MKCHSNLLLLIAIMACSLLIALSTGTPFFLFVAVLTALAAILGLIGVCHAAHSLKTEVILSENNVHRGDDVHMTLRVSCQGIIPISPPLITLRSLSGLPETKILLTGLPGKPRNLSLPFHASHVGVSDPGITSCQISDLFGLFTVNKSIPKASGECLVLPSSFETVPLTFAPGDPGSEIMSRATEDLNAPSDIRAYQSGDPIKKIHWKLSLRKNELLVRKYDEPILTDALVLLDTSAPPSMGHPEADADLRDTLLETAASVCHDLQKTDHMFRMPLAGNHPMEIDRNTGLDLTYENLSRVDFSSSEKFERILQIESGRLRKVGCVVIITARLNSYLIDLMIRIRRTGPVLRLYFITFTPNDPLVLPLIGKLKQASIEVSYVTPESV